MSMSWLKAIDWWVLIGCLVAVTCAFLAGHYGDPVDVVAFGYFALLFSVTLSSTAERRRP